jgi:phage terminase small subunit
MARQALTVAAANGRPSINPVVNIWLRAATAQQQAGEALGLSPSSRTRLPVPKQDEDEEALLEEMGLFHNAFAPDVHPGERPLAEALAGKKRRAS